MEIFNTLGTLPALYAVADCSGSMTELGQQGILAYCLGHLLRIKEEGVFFSDVKIYTLSDRIQEFTGLTDSGFPECSGCCAPEQLPAVLGEVPPRSAFLFMGDGSYYPSEWERTEQLVQERQLAAVFLEIGAACATHTACSRLFTHFPAEELPAALLHLACCRELPAQWPTLSHDTPVSPSMPAEIVAPQEDEDEW